MPTPSTFLRRLDRTCGLLVLLVSVTPLWAQPVIELDLATTPTTHDLRRIYGSIGGGAYGVPVAGGGDMDGDSHADVAMAAMTASTFGRTYNGRIFVSLGTGSVSGAVDTRFVLPRVLRIDGAQQFENAGSEIWMDDVTGDGLADLLICRQNFTPEKGTLGTARAGAGALTLLIGGAEISTFAASGQIADLASPPAGLTFTTILGVDKEDRLGIWVRTGDVDGDGVKDILVGADRRTVYPGIESCGASCDNGVVYLIRGGAHLAAGGEYDLADFGQAGFGLAGSVAEIRPPSPAIADPPIPSGEYHFGATLQVADLDGNGRAEVLASAALNRIGASLSPDGGFGDGVGGQGNGTLYIVWDDNFPEPPWSDGFTVVANADPTKSSVITGSSQNDNFGEELLGGLDYDNDGRPDLFVGDITGFGPNGFHSGLGYVLFDAALWKGVDTEIALPPSGALVTEIYGPSAQAIGSDTALHGDFDGDGVDDLAVSSPKASPLGRVSSGEIHVLFGNPHPWPSTLDLASPPAPAIQPVAEIWGAEGAFPGNSGDTLSYSAAAGDIDGDGRIDLITNEMEGDGTISVDVGNLIVLSGRLLEREFVFQNGFEQATLSKWARVEPPVVRRLDSTPRSGPKPRVEEREP